MVSELDDVSERTQVQQESILALESLHTLNTLSSTFLLLSFASAALIALFTPAYPYQYASLFLSFSSASINIPYVRTVSPL